MSGWDEAAVFYGDQGQSPPAAEILTTTTLFFHSAVCKFKEFIRGFCGNKGDFPYRPVPLPPLSPLNIYIYTLNIRRDSLVHNPDHLTIVLEDLDAFDVDLSDKILKLPANILPLFETAAAEVLDSLRSKVSVEEPITGTCNFFSSKENSVSIRSIGIKYMSNFVKIAGISIGVFRLSEGQGIICDFHVQELQEHQDGSLPAQAWGCHSSKIL